MRWQAAPRSQGARPEPQTTGRRLRCPDRGIPVGQFYFGVDTRVGNCGQLRCPRDRASLVNHSPPVVAATVPAVRLNRILVPRTALAPVAAVTAILVMEISAAAVRRVATRQGNHRRLGREIQATRVLALGSATTGSCLDADGVIGIRDAMRPDFATGKPHRRLYTLAVPPGRYPEHRGCPRLSAPVTHCIQIPSRPPSCSSLGPRGRRRATCLRRPGLGYNRK